ncbi:MAG: hypothetical protein KF729_16685 [Sandaracinaceae bacterium]|nr:hypothetical protein [Sandaracinaceae bacterium]
MSTLALTRHAAETARRRRSHLTARATLSGVARLGACLAHASFRMRARLDPRGGAFDRALA